VEEDVTQLIEWLSKQPHLPKITGEFVNNNDIKYYKYYVKRNKNIYIYNKHLVIFPKCLAVIFEFTIQKVLLFSM